MKIRLLLPLVIGALVLMVAGLAGRAAYETRLKDKEAERFLEVNRISEAFIKSTGDWALERGLTNKALAAPDAESPETRAKIAALRKDADLNYKDAIASLAKVPQMKSSQDAIAATQAAFDAVGAIRQKADADILKPETARDPAVARSFLQTFTDLIDKVGNLSLTMETVTLPPTVRIEQLVGLRHLSAEMAEYAGRERARLSAAIEDKRPLHGDELSALSVERGHIELAWSSIRSLRARADTPPELLNAFDRVEKDYFQTYDGLRKQIMDAAETAAYPVSGREYFAQATTAIDSILNLAAVMGHTADSESEANAAKNLADFQFSIAILLFALILAGVSFWISVYRVANPIGAMTDAMSKLAGGDKGVEVPGLKRRDEVGAMAAAVQVFKENAIAIEKMQAEQAAAKEKADREKRQVMLDLADGFESSIKGVVDMVSSASTEMQATAQALASMARQTSTQAVAVSSASEETSVSVQTVASATEELSASIGEIGSQVTQATRVTNAAASDGQNANVTMKSLADSAQKIGEVVRLIQGIAGQTNLLALNATIEAARAGDAGKGFSVVASEVKALANQTALATEEIERQIISIQSETHAAVGMIEGICNTLDDVKDVSASIAAAVEEQSSATKEIARNVQQAAEGTSQVSHSIVDVTAAANETGTSATQMLDAASELARQSEILRSEVDKFLATVRAG